MSLIDGGAAVNYAKSDGWSPLLVAAQMSHVGIARCLLDRGASIEQPNNMGVTALCAGRETRSAGRGEVAGQAESQHRSS